jgi:hypothetical protein
VGISREELNTPNRNLFPSVIGAGSPADVLSNAGEKGDRLQDHRRMFYRTLEKKATGGSIRSIFGPARGADGRCQDWSVGTSKAESDRWCQYSTFVDMYIDGPGDPTNNTGWRAKR